MTTLTWSVIVCANSVQKIPTEGVQTTEIRQYHVRETIVIKEIHKSAQRYKCTQI